MVKNVADPELREHYGNIINDQYPYEVYCLNPGTFIDDKGKERPFHAKKCKIGYITQKNQCIDLQAQDKNGRILAGIETSRDRFDGKKGFRCYCGNNSITAEEEKDMLESSPIPNTARPPTREELIAIYEKITVNGKEIGTQFINGEAEYDGFLVKEIK